MSEFLRCIALSKCTAMIDQFLVRLMRIPQWRLLRGRGGTRLHQLYVAATRIEYVAPARRQFTHGAKQQ